MNKTNRTLWITQYFLMKYMQGLTEFDERDFIENSLITFNPTELKVIRKWWKHLTELKKTDEIDYLQDILYLKQLLDNNDYHIDESLFE